MTSLPVRPQWENKTEDLTTYLHRPRTTTSPLSFLGDRRIVPFESVFSCFSRRSGESCNPTCSTVAEQFLDQQTSPKGNFNAANFFSFAISFAIAHAPLANCPPFSTFRPNDYEIMSILPYITGNVGDLYLSMERILRITTA
ncbi:hypothetical protein DVH24_002795 [Malus domestica]|uniref:Uncharacterized protein ycf72 n=1 Tax=Malus domestica TaxID=3750 RepID=A0A498K5X6_MALDO|nr:hypothetical protein DVH24_002795 [Malus domestica]